MISIEAAVAKHACQRELHASLTASCDELFYALCPCMHKFRHQAGVGTGMLHVSEEDVLQGNTALMPARSDSSKDPDLIIG